MPGICGADIHTSATSDAEVIIIMDLFSSSGYCPGRAKGHTKITTGTFIFVKDPLAV